MYESGAETRLEYEFLNFCELCGAHVGFKGRHQKKIENFTHLKKWDETTIFSFYLGIGNIFAGGIKFKCGIFHIFLVPSLMTALKQCPM